MTGATADRYGIPERGYLKVGYRADITVLDLDALRVDETMPDFRPTGVAHVYVNGQAVYARIVIFEDCYRITRRCKRMIQKLKKRSTVLGLVFTVAAGLFTVGMTYVAYIDQQAYARMQMFLFDCGVDAIGALVAAGLYYGCMRQEGEGTEAFRTLNVFVSAGFVVNFLLFLHMGCAGVERIYLHIRHAQQADRPPDNLFLLSVHEEDARF